VVDFQEYQVIDEQLQRSGFYLQLQSVNQVTVFSPEFINISPSTKFFINLQRESLCCTVTHSVFGLLILLNDQGFNLCYQKL
jgi:hypothetical protein